MARQTEAVKKLVEQELANLTPAAGSWHTQYSRSAYVYIGNLDPRLTEGDIVTVFSQFGDIVDINLARDKETGKSMGFCFLAFENQKSTILAIDNMIGYELLGRPLRVDHVLDYKPPKRYSETELDEEGFPKRIPYEPTGAEGKGVGVYNVTDSQRRLNMQGLAMDAMVKKAEPDSNIDEDELWAKMFEDKLKSELPPIKQERSPTRAPRS
jgi:RNA-binding motif X-linked protein 2